LSSGIHTEESDAAKYGPKLQLGGRRRMPKRLKRHTDPRQSMIQVSQSELMARMYEALMGVERPAGMTAKEYVLSLGSRDDLWTSN
jgi:hypothetical protein